MSLFGAYETSKLGPTTRISFNVSGGAVVRVRLRPLGSTKPVSFAIRSRDIACRVRQGGSTVTISATDVGMQVSTTLRWRLDVEADSEGFIAILGDDAATSGSLEITKISDVVAYESGETPVIV